MKKSKNCFGLVLCGMFLMTQLSCSNSPTSPPNTGTIKISIKGVSSGAPNSSPKVVGSTAALTTVTSAHVVIEKIRFDSTVDDTLDYRFREPFVQDLMVGSSLHEIETIQVPFGEYKRTRIDIDDLDSEDGAVYTQNPDLQERSILVKGYLNGDQNENFVFTSSFSEEQEREFDPPLILDDNNNSTNLVLSLNMDTWFVDDNGILIDPRSTNNKNIIEDRIKASIEVFEDKDDDGEKDN